MKSVKIVFEFFKGNRIAAFITLLLMAVSLILTVYVCAEINYISYDKDMIDDVDLTRVYSGMSFPTKDKDGFLVFLDSDDIEAEFESHPAILDVYTFPTTTYFIKDFPANFQTGANIMLVSEDFMKNMPDLANSGIDFSKIENPETDCIIISPLLGVYEIGDKIKLDGDSSVNEIKVVGKAASPYKFFAFFSATNGDYSLSSIFYPRLQTDNIVLMKETEKTRELFGKNSYSARNFIFEFKPEATEEEMNEVIIALENKGALLTSFDKILENTSTEAAKELRSTLPFPLFLLTVSFVAYVSMLILMFKKKEREFAVYSITGASRKRIAATYMTASSLMMLPAVILTTALCMLFQIAARGRNPIPLPLYVNGWIYLIIACYALLNLAISAVITYSGMKKYSPLQFLRGVTK